MDADCRSLLRRSPSYPEHGQALLPASCAPSISFFLLWKTISLFLAFCSYTMICLGFVSSYLTYWDLLGFLNWYTGVFHYCWEIRSHYIFKYLLYLSFFLLPFWNSDYICIFLSMAFALCLPHLLTSLLHFPSFCIWDLDNFFWSVFQLASSYSSCA